MQLVPWLASKALCSQKWNRSAWYRLMMGQSYHFALGRRRQMQLLIIWCCITRKEWCFFFWKLLVKPGRLLMQLWTLVRRSGWQRRTLAPLQQSAVKQLAVSILIIKVLLQPISLGHAHDPSWVVLLLMVSWLPVPCIHARRAFSFLYIPV